MRFSVVAGVASAVLVVGVAGCSGDSGASASPSVGTKSYAEICPEVDAALVKTLPVEGDVEFSPEEFGAAAAALELIYPSANGQLQALLQPMIVDLQALRADPQRNNQQGATFTNFATDAQKFIAECAKNGASIKSGLQPEGEGS